MFAHLVAFLVDLVVGGGEATRKDSEIPVLRHRSVLAVYSIQGQILALVYPDCQKSPPDRVNAEGYSRRGQCRLARNHGTIASSAALTDGPRVDQSDEEFDAALDQTIASIFAASKT